MRFLSPIRDEDEDDNDRLSESELEPVSEQSLSGDLVSPEPEVELDDVLEDSYAPFAALVQSFGVPCCTAKVRRFQKPNRTS